jgi:hypothetical protein
MPFIRTQQVADRSFLKTTGASGKRCLTLVQPGSERVGRPSGLAGKLPFETPIDSLTCSSNTVQNGSSREHDRPRESTFLVSFDQCSDARSLILIIGNAH